MAHPAKIDVHYHPGEWDHLSAQPALPSLLRTLDRFNIVCAVLAHSLAVFSDSCEGNREVVKLCMKDRRLRAYLYLNPHDVRGSMEDLKRYGEDPRIIGVKTRSVYHSAQMDTPGYVPLFQEAARRQLSLLYHSSERPTDFEIAPKVLEQIPHLTVIWTHATWEAARKLRANPRMYFDIASSFADRSTINLEGMVALVGEERVVFGSDAPYISPAWGMGKIDSADLTPQQRQKIYYDNALRAFPRLKL